MGYGPSRTIKDSYSQRHPGLNTASAHLELQEPCSHSRRAARKSPWPLARLLYKHAREPADRLERPTSKDFMCFVNLPHSPPCAGALHDFDVKRAVCKNIEHEPVSYLVVWMTTDLGPISHASVDNGDARCRQQQQPDGHASAGRMRRTWQSCDALRTKM